MESGGTLLGVWAAERQHRPKSRLQGSLTPWRHRENRACAILSCHFSKGHSSILLPPRLLACHWRRPIAGCVLDGEAVNRRLGNQLGWPRLLSLHDIDFRLDVWSSDPRSVAQREDFV